MDPLLDELTRRGVLNEATAPWVRAHQTKRRLTLDAALLDLDLVDEEILLSCLEASSGLAAVKASDLDRVEPSVAKRLPEGFSRSFGLCPMRLDGTKLLACVERPLSKESVEELTELFQLEPRQLIAASHQMAVVRERVYKTPIDDVIRELSDKLERRRRSCDLATALAGVASARSFGSAVSAVLEFAAARVAYACLLVLQRGGLRVADARGDGAKRGVRLAPPGPGCSLSAVIQYGGCFVGPPKGTDADGAFYESLGRKVPRSAALLPLPAPKGTAVLLCADNGERGIATSWVAELMLLTSRLGRKRDDHPAALSEAPERPPAPVPEASSVVATPTVTPLQIAVLERLERAAVAAGQDLDAFVDGLLRQHGAPPPAAPPVPDQTGALVGEMKGLFERLATDIPTQLARGLELAFRDMVPRLAAGAAAAPPPHAEGAAASSASASLLVKKETQTPREVAVYSARRRKAPIVKL